MDRIPIYTPMVLIGGFEAWCHGSTYCTEVWRSCSCCS
ncbi:hypothetical protein GYH30_029127 [Glycine max]|nr:hypothetical protein GYH30_029127 [Glycine max]